MKSLTVFLAATAIIFLMPGCTGNYQQESVGDKQKETAAPVSSLATLENPHDTIRKFIRTSDIKFRVKDVALATYQIEDITRNFNGFVTYTRLESTTEDKEVTQLNLDSSLETIHYSVVNNMTIRVPNVKLDSTLKAITSLVDYLEYRTIKADDVSLQIKANQKTQSRAHNNGQRLSLAIDKHGKELNKTANAENLVTDRQKEADEAEIANLSLLDQMSYSTVNLLLYQRTESKQWLIANDDSGKYQPNLGLRLWESVKVGWRIVADIFVFLTRFWLLILLGIIGVVLYKKYKPGKLTLKA